MTPTITHGMRGVQRELAHRIIEENDHLRRQLNRLIAAYERIRTENEPHWSVVTAGEEVESLSA